MSYKDRRNFIIPYRFVEAVESQVRFEVVRVIRVIQARAINIVLSTRDPF